MEVHTRRQYRACHYRRSERIRVTVLVCHEAETGRVVPTWDYVAVHAHGTVRFFGERERLLEVVTRLTARQEHARAAPWNVGDAPPDYLEGLLKGIVGVELTITRLEGQWKASQNKVEADRRGVEVGLREEGNGAMADLVRQRGA